VEVGFSYLWRALGDIGDTLMRMARIVWPLKDFCLQAAALIRSEVTRRCRGKGSLSQSCRGLCTRPSLASLPYLLIRTSRGTTPQQQTRSHIKARPMSMSIIHATASLKVDFCCSSRSLLIGRLTDDGRTPCWCAWFLPRIVDSCLLNP
jgi:hypothetical protein